MDCPWPFVREVFLKPTLISGHGQLLQRIQCLSTPWQPVLKYCCQPASMW